MYQEHRLSGNTTSGSQGRIETFWTPVYHFSPQHFLVPYLAPRLPSTQFHHSLQRCLLNPILLFPFF